MFYGVLATDGVVLLTDAAHGKPISEQASIDPPEGYVIRDVWVDTGAELVLCHDCVPEEGTPQEAALALARMQARSLPDEALYEVRALAPDYEDGMTCYGDGNEECMPVTRARYLGGLYRFAGQGAQVMQPGWNPVDAPSLWSRILPGQEGSDQSGPQPWERPGSTNGYSEGDQVTWNGHLWTSIVNDNVDEPGTDNGFRWRDDGPAEGGEA